MKYLSELKFYDQAIELGLATEIGVGYPVMLMMKEYQKKNGEDEDEEVMEDVENDLDEFDEESKIDQTGINIKI